MGCPPFRSVFNPTASQCVMAGGGIIAAELGPKRGADFLIPTFLPVLKRRQLRITESTDRTGEPEFHEPIFCQHVNVRNGWEADIG